MYNIFIFCLKREYIFKKFCVSQLSFSELAPLNGIQVFGKVHSVIFESTKGKNFTIYWKNFTEK